MNDSTPKGAVAKAEQHQPTQFEVQIAEQRPKFLAALPANMDADKFERVIVTAINNNPELWTKGDRRSLFNACVQAATDGLLPDGREGALVIYNTKVNGNWIKMVQWMPMIYGLRKRMRNSGEVAKAVANVVYGNDHFEYVLGDDERIEHKPALQDRGEFVGAYAIITLTNGEVIREYMSKQEIDEIRAASKSPDSPAWRNWYGEMARKSVLRRASKAAPMNSEDMQFFQRPEDYGAGQVIEGSAETAPPRPTRGAIEHHVDPDAEDTGGDTDDGPEPPSLDFVDQHGEIVATFHDAADYLETLAVEIAKPKTPEGVVAIYEHNEGAILKTKEAFAPDEMQWEGLVEPIRDAYLDAEARMLDAEKAGVDEKGDGAAEASDDAGDDDLTPWQVEMVYNNDDPPKPSWLKWYNEIVKVAEKAESPDDVARIREANAIAFENMAKTEKSHHKRLMGVLDKRAEALGKEAA